MKLSIILPVAWYNNRWLDCAIASARWGDEMIIVSDRGAETACRKRAGKNRKHFTVQSPPGPEAAINYGIARATGTHYSLLCSDDFYLPGCKEVKTAAEKSGADVCYGSVLFSGLLSGRWPLTGDTSNLERENCVPAGAIVRREWWRRVGGYRDVRYSDWDFWKRLNQIRNKCGPGPRFEFVSVDFYHYRAWSGTISARYGYRSDLGHQWDLPDGSKKPQEPPGAVSTLPGF